MESVSTSDALIRPWRTATVVVAAIAVAELLVLLALGISTFGQSLLDAATGSTTHAARPATSHTQRTATSHSSLRVDTHEKLAAPRLPRSETSVLILNGNGIAGAAADESQLLHQKHYIVADVGNAGRTDYPRSLVMYRPGFKPEAARLARDLRVRIVSPLDGLRKSDLMGAHVAVVIGRK